MKKTTLLLWLLLAGVSPASIQNLVGPLGSTNLAVQTEAQATLFFDCSNAGRPGAEAERKMICEEICAVLNTGGSASVTSQLVRNLQRIGAEESVDTLVSMLGSSDLHLRDDVRQALAVNPSPQAGQALQAQLKMRKARTPRWTAGLIIALGERGDTGTSQLISPHLMSLDPMVFSATATALSRLNEFDGIKALATQYMKESAERKSRLASALFETDRLKIFQRLYADTELDEVRAVALLGLVLSQASNVAEEGLASGKIGFQSAVIDAASQRKDDALYDLLAKNLEALSPCLQVQALGVLEFSGDRRFSAVVVPWLSSNDGNVQVAAAQALSKIGSAEAVPALLLSGTDVAKKALGLIVSEGTDEALLKAAESGDGAQRAVAIGALALRGRVQVELFFAYAAEVDQQVAKAAVLAIGMRGLDADLDRAVSLLLVNEKSPLSRDILKVIVAMVRRSADQGLAVEILVAQIQNASPHGQSLLLQALSQVGSNEALGAVVLACHAENEALRKAAVKLLGNWRGENALPALIELAADESVPLSSHVLAIRGISRLLAGQKRLDEPKAIQALGICRRTDEKKLMIGVLAKVKSPEALASVTAYLSDPELQSVAEEALSKMKKAENKRK